MRRTKVRFIDAGDWRFNYIFDIFWKTAISANDDFFQFNVSRLTHIQFAEYNSNVEAEYKEHRDVFWINNDPTYHRKLSAVLQLSDENSYSGGKLELTDTGTVPPPNDIIKQGTLIYFPSFTYHRVTPVTSGIRYSLVAWFEGKKWA
jgi:PKHD-type hydroxylase